MYSNIERLEMDYDERRGARNRPLHLDMLQINFFSTLLIEFIQTLVTRVFRIANSIINH